MHHLRALLIPVFFIAGAYITVWPHHQERQLVRTLRNKHLPVPAGQVLIGKIETAGDRNELAAQRESNLVLAGWAVFTDPRDPLQQLDVLIDGKKIAEVQDFSSRPNIEDAYGRPDFEASGWQTTVSLTGVTPGNHLLLVRATSQRGGTADMPSLILNIK